MSRTPQIVKDVARDLIKMYGDNIDYLGKHEGADVYYYHFPDDTDTGFPYVYLLKAENVTEITGFEALQLLGRYLKD